MIARLPLFTGMLALALLLGGGCSRPDPAATLRQAAQATSKGQWHAALDAAGDCLRHDRTNVDALLIQGLCYHMLDQSVKALERFRKAQRAAPEDFETNYFLGWALCRERRHAEALPYLESALAARAGHIDTLVLLGECCLEQNLPDGIVYLEELLATPRYAGGQRRAQLLSNIAYLHTVDKKYETARARLAEAVKTQGTLEPAAFINMAALYDNYLHDPEKAMRYYRYSLAACQKTGGDPATEATILTRLRQLARNRRNTSEP